VKHQLLSPIRALDVAVSHSYGTNSSCVNALPKLLSYHLVLRASHSNLTCH
jgi:hypothetical protein